MYPNLEAYVKRQLAAVREIPEERRALLDELAEFVRGRVRDDRPVRLIFICTHNSRRSHFGQVWGQVAAMHFQVPRVATFSGGTEATAFNPRAVDALRRAGFDIPEPPPQSNPRYAVHASPDAAPMTCFSKRYDDETNPHEDFGAIMTCSQADQGCPIVAGAVFRLSLPYDDPKAFDGAPEETAKYDERCAQIASEMLYAFSRVAEER